MRDSRRSRGQASVELVALLPAIALVVAALWQGVVAGQALWLSGSAARAAARAHAVGDDTQRAARAALPGSLVRRVSVEERANDTVTVRIRVPAIVGGGTVGTVAAVASLPRQR